MKPATPSASATPPTNAYDHAAQPPAAPDVKQSPANLEDPDIVAVRDASWPRKDSKVWHVQTSTGDIYVKISRTPERLDREVRAYQRATAVLGDGRAPQLIAADTELQVVATASLPGVLVRAISPEPDEERTIHGLAGTLLGRWHEHASPVSAAERHRAVVSVMERVAELPGRLERIAHLISEPQRAFAEDAREKLPKLAEDLPLKFRHGDFQPRNWQWDRTTGSVALLDFEEADFGIAVEDFTWCPFRGWFDLWVCRGSGVGGLACA